MRQIVLCCDGTNNTLTGRQRDTNVLRLFEHLASQRDDRQLLYYDPGVGSPDALPATDPLDWLRRKWERVSGLASGRGAFENIGEGYAFLMRHWQPGTQIFIFGFSRGAFTARSISGLVHLFGVLKPEHESLLPTLLRVYFSPRGDEVPSAAQRRRQRLAQIFFGLEIEPHSARTREDVAAQIRDGFTSPAGRDAGVHFVGVWDTVEAIGLPGLALRISSVPTIRGKRIAHARHALALDEHRLAFAPRLYGDDNFGTGGDAQSLVQLWFRGAHGDSGGGYAHGESGLADAALGWMVDEAGACGLRSAPLPAGTAAPLAHDAVHTVPWWAAAGLALRDTASHRLPHHASVAALAPRVASVWRTRRAAAPWLLALLGAATFATLHGALLLGQWASFADMLGAGARLAHAQLSMLWALPLGDARAAWQAVPKAHAGWAMAADFGLVASYAYLLGRLVSRAFARRAGWRDAGDALPAWHRLGRALPLAIAGDVVENTATLVALAFDGVTLPLWLGAAGVGAAAKWLGIAGCLALVAIGLWPARRR